MVDYTSATFEPLMEHEVNGLDYRYVYGNDRLSVNISGVETSSGNLIENGDQIRLYYHMDYLGTTDYLTSPVSLKVTSWTHYNEWGEITHNAVLKTGQRELDLVKRFATHDYDAVLNMYYAKARFYDAENRRFAAVDPIKGSIAEPLSLVPYVYCVDSPLAYVDPNGEFIIEVMVVMAVAGTVSAVVSMAVEATVELITTKEVDLGKVAIKGAQGFAVGAISASPLSGVGVIIGTGIASAAGSAAMDAYTNYTGETSYTGVEIAARAAKGGAIGAAVSGLTLGVQMELSGAYWLPDGSTGAYVAVNTSRTVWQNVFGIPKNAYLIHQTGEAMIRSVIIDTGISVAESVVLDGAVPLIEYFCKSSCQQNSNEQSSYSPNGENDTVQNKTPSENSGKKVSKSIPTPAKTGARSISGRFSSTMAVK